jgi:hypothetical protein
MKLYLYPSIALAFVRGFQVYLRGLDTWKARDVNVKKDVTIQVVI